MQTQALRPLIGHTEPLTFATLNAQKKPSFLNRASILVICGCGAMMLAYNWPF